MEGQQRKVALVLGASRGIGRAIAQALAEAGYDVAIGARTLAQGQKQKYWSAAGDQPARAIKGSLEETAQDVRNAGVRALCVKMDLLDVNGCVAAVEHVFNEFGRLDVVVNSAVYQGKGHLSRFLDIETKDYSNILLCNAITPAAIFKAALRIMLEQHTGGCLVQLSSSSLNMTPRFPVDKGGWDFGYASSKSAASKLMPLLAVEHPLSDSNVRFFNVEPGLVVTELMKENKLDKNYSSGFGSVPPQVTGAVVSYLARAEESDVARFNGKSVYAPRLCEKLGLIPGYVEQKPKKAESKL